ncbi:hypothetical protein PhiBP823_57 [Burkholderia phage PhiBP82.3]|nr:hypothetical protein PhiBP823_57 [Burkholderia phage PhiBP82.3]
MQRNARFPRNIKRAETHATRAGEPGRPVH